MLKKAKIKNFKGFKETFEINFNQHLNIIVGDNEVGKSTILEAINLALTGLYNGRPLYRNLNQYIFNIDAVNEYLASLKTENPLSPPEIIIELFFEENEDLSSFTGDFHSDKGIIRENTGVRYTVKMDDKYTKEYQELIELSKNDDININTLPVEYYTIDWKDFSRDSITARSIPIKTSFIDVGLKRISNGSDVYISRIVRDIFEEPEIIKISQAYRQTKEKFQNDESIVKANQKIKTLADKDDDITISANLSSTWQDALITQINSIPFENIGKGQQVMLKTKLSLSNKKSEKAQIILIEEPESHISHANLNKQLDYISRTHTDKQIFITTHSSFVSNKLGLKDLILLSKNNKVIKLNSLDLETQNYFKKIAGYDTLRMILSNETLLVEGDSDELVVQKAYLTEYGNLPIHDGIEVISVGTAFLRFLEIARKLKLKVGVVLDNDGDVNAIERKFSDYSELDNISIYFEREVDARDKLEDKKFNFNTLEPIILKYNSLKKMNEILDKDYKNKSELLKYMKRAKTDVALKIFEYEEDLVFPNYILEAIEGE